MMILHTNFGPIHVTLHTDKTPETAENFARYAAEGFYDGVIFHRVIDGFMIQGGGFDAKMQEKETKASIDNEADKGISNKRGTLSMARTSDPHSASAQFFINLKDNTFLDFKSKTTQGYGYCVFGEVTQGMEVVDKIAKVSTGNYMGHGDVPKDPVIIERVEMITADA